MISNEHPSALIVRNIEVLSPQRVKELTAALGRIGLEVQPIYDEPDKNEIMPENLWAPLVIIPNKPEYGPHPKPDYGIARKDFSVCAENYGYSTSIAARAFNTLATRGYQVGSYYRKEDQLLSFIEVKELTESITQHGLRTISAMPQVGEKVISLIDLVVLNKQVQIEVYQQGEAIKAIG